MEDECPEGFEWTCCQEAGDEEEGCEIDVHRDAVAY